MNVKTRFSAALDKVAAQYSATPNASKINEIVQQIKTDMDALPNIEQMYIYFSCEKSDSEADTLKRAKEIIRGYSTGEMRI